MNHFQVRVREAKRDDIQGIVRVSSTSILPNEDVGFGGGPGSTFHDSTKLASLWKDPNMVGREEVLVAKMGKRLVGCVTIQDRGHELEFDQY